MSGIAAVIALVIAGVFGIGVTIGRILERRAIERINGISDDYSGAL